MPRALPVTRGGRRKCHCTRYAHANERRARHNVLSADNNLRASALLSDHRQRSPLCRESGRATFCRVCWRGFLCRTLSRSLLQQQQRGNSSLSRLYYSAMPLLSLMTRREEPLRALWVAVRARARRRRSIMSSINYSVRPRSFIYLFSLTIGFICLDDFCSLSVHARGSVLCYSLWCEFHMLFATRFFFL